VPRRGATRPTVRCAIYTRQSVVRPDSDPARASCAVQRDYCLAFVRTRSARGWIALDEHFDDEGYSGASVERPALERLVERVVAGQVDRIVVHRLDRLTRRLSDWARFADLLRTRNVELSVVAGGLGTDDGSLARLQLNALSTFAEWERDLIRDRLADARAVRRAAGARSSGRVPFGYASDPGTKQLVIRAEEAQVVRRFFVETDVGSTPAELVALAARQRFPSKRGGEASWSGREVLRILRNPTYAGRFPDGSPASHVAIVEPELWDRVQAVVANRKTRATSERGQPDARFDPFVLRGLLTCGDCQRPMTTSMSTKLTTKSAKAAPRYYRCRSAGCGGQVSSQKVEEHVLKTLAEPPAMWAEPLRAQLRQYAAVWEALWPVNRRRAIASVFGSVTWHRNPDRLVFELTEATLARE
jgi:site-specific DNA recombinase